MNKLAIIAALEREVAPLVSGWARTSVPSQNRDVVIFARGNVLVAFAGMGGMGARAAADAVYQHAAGKLDRMVSVGLAGALAPELKVGDIIRPATVIDEADGQRIDIPGGEGILVSCGTVADASLKHTLAQKHIARAVDMEAYAVADVARVYGVPFSAIKVISDDLDFPMPQLGRFVGDRGEFQTGRFILHAALRPWLWSTVSRLGANSTRATKALCRELELLMKPYA